MDEEIATLKREIQALKDRNIRVETDKKWEMSNTRIVFIAVIVYVVAVIILTSLHALYPLFAAFLPVAGFYVSTLSLPYVRRLWEKGSRADIHREKFRAED